LVRKVIVTAIAIFLAGASIPARAQDLVRVGVLSPQDALKIGTWDQALRKRLKELGWVEGKNIAFEYRHANGDIRRLPLLAKELLSLKPALVIALNGISARAVQHWSKSIPIVMPYTADAVRQGIVRSLSKPGGNITGLSEMVLETSVKRLEILKETTPDGSHIAILWHPENVVSRLSWEDIQVSAERLGVTVEALPVRSVSEMEQAFAQARKRGVGGIAITAGAIFGANLRAISALSIRYGLPAIWVRKEFTTAGGLFSLGPARIDLFRRAASYVDKIAKGAKPADLPIEQPTKFELVVNLRTAKALGIQIPRSILLRADEVIE